MRRTLLLPLPLVAAVITVSGVSFAQAPPEPPPAWTPPPAAPPAAPAPGDTTAVAPPPPVVTQDAAPPEPEEEPSKADTSPLAKDGHPLAGFHNGLFFLRDYNDNFVLFPQGRAQIDTYTYFGSGVGDTTLKPTMFLRRVRPELTGEIMHHWWFMIAGDFAPTALDNANGKSEQYAATAGVAPTAGTSRYLQPQTAAVKAAATDVYLAYKADEALYFQAGQFDAPMTMQNRTSDKYFEFIERPLAIRDVAIASNKDIGIMAHGWADKRVFYYSLGGFNGAGQNRLNTDGRFTMIGRIYARPLAASAEGAIKDLQIGVSGRIGSHDNKYTFYDYQSMTTQGNYAFWVPTYGGTNGFTHIIPSGTQSAFAAELRVPLSMFDLTGEFVYLSDQTREALDGFQATNTERYGDIHGYSYYVQVGFWPLGNRDINGIPGDENYQHINWKKPDPESPKQALQLLVKWEQLALTYNSNSRDGLKDPKGIDGDINVNAFSLGANYWATKHIRISANYILDMFPSSAPSSATTPGSAVWSASQRAQAPGNTLAKGVNDDARNNASSLHELIFRFAVAL
jgi:hypothetical protein